MLLVLSYFIKCCIVNLFLVRPINNSNWMNEASLNGNFALHDNSTA